MMGYRVFWGILQFAICDVFLCFCVFLGGLDRKEGWDSRASLDTFAGRRKLSISLICAKRAWVMISLLSLSAVG
jgi:hypothetical protein